MWINAAGALKKCELASGDVSVGNRKGKGRATGTQLLEPVGKTIDVLEVASWRKLQINRKGKGRARRVGAGGWRAGAVVIYEQGSLARCCQQSCEKADERYGGGQEVLFHDLRTESRPFYTNAAQTSLIIFDKRCSLIRSERHSLAQVVEVPRRRGVKRLIVYVPVWLAPRLAQAPLQRFLRERAVATALRRRVLRKCQSGSDRPDPPSPGSGEASRAGRLPQRAI